MDFGLRGKTAVVTGADSGIGEATARLLLKEGASVVIADKEQREVNRAVSELKSGGMIHGTVVDVTKPECVEGLQKFALEKLGKVDIVVNAAGITGATDDFHAIDDAGWQEAIEIDLLGAMRIVRAFLPHMMDRKAGRIILISSEDALQPYPDELPYCAAKAGILSLAKGLSKGYAKYGILVNAVSPAFIATPMTDAMMEKRAKKNGSSVDEAIESFLDEERPTLELHRRGKPEEVAAAIVFLCAQQATFITGANLRVDGGSVATI